MAKVRPVYDLDAMRSARDQWITDAEKDWRENISTATSQLSASGGRPGSSFWDVRMEQIEAAHRERLTEIEGTETVRIIKNEEQYLVKQEEYREEARKQGALSGERAFMEGDPGSRQPDYFVNFGTGKVEHKSTFTLGQLDSRVRRADLDKAAGIEQSVGRDSGIADINQIRNLSNSEYLKQFGAGFI